MTGETGVKSGEFERQPSVEEKALVRLGYEHVLDAPIEEGSAITGRNFLDAYGDSPKRQETEELLAEFSEMKEGDPGYDAMKKYITRFIQAVYGPPLEA
jgi:hypothetical protein